MPLIRSGLTRTIPAMGSDAPRRSLLEHPELAVPPRRPRSCPVGHHRAAPVPPDRRAGAGRAARAVTRTLRRSPCWCARSRSTEASPTRCRTAAARSSSHALGQTRSHRRPCRVRARALLRGQPRRSVEGRSPCRRASEHRAPRSQPCARPDDTGARGGRARAAGVRTGPCREGEGGRRPDRHQPQLARRKRSAALGAVLASEGKLAEAERELAYAEHFFRDEIATVPTPGCSFFSSASARQRGRLDQADATLQAARKDSRSSQTAADSPRSPTPSNTSSRPKRPAPAAERCSNDRATQSSPSSGCWPAICRHVRSGSASSSPPTRSGRTRVRSTASSAPTPAPMPSRGRPRSACWSEPTPVVRVHLSESRRVARSSRNHRSVDLLRRRYVEPLQARAR